jgi:fatty-acyl-CoA synthase
MTTVAQVLRSRADSDAPALCFGDSTWSYREFVAEAEQRSALAAALLDPAEPPHVGVLLDNIPDYLFWLGAAAISGFVIIGINST